LLPKLLSFEELAVPDFCHSVLFGGSLEPFVEFEYVCHPMFWNLAIT
jgi:hypothetical protein